MANMANMASGNCNFISFHPIDANMGRMECCLATTSPEPVEFTQVNGENEMTAKKLVVTNRDDVIYEGKTVGQ